MLGVQYPTQKHYSELAKKVLFDKDVFVEFAKDKTVNQISKSLCVNKNTIMIYVRKYDAKYSNRSTYLELEMAEFLNKCGVKFIANDRTLIRPLELDFYMPDHNLAIEMNGIYWHSDIYLDKNYHYKKYKTVKNTGNTLVQIDEWLWKTQNDKMKELVKARLGIKHKGVAARKCHVKKITNKIARPFLDTYHIQGHVNGSYVYGASCSDGHLVGIMSFGKTRNGRFELKRWCMDNKTHAGLFSKVFKFAKSDIGFDEVVSFSDNRWFGGNLYEVNGFKNVGELKPDYQYFYNGRLYSKQSFTKSKLRKRFSDNETVIGMLDSGCTEKQVTDHLNIYRFWNAGRIEWKYLSSADNLR